MKKLTLCLFALFLVTLNSFASDGFHNESEAGLIFTSGNTQNENYNVNQLDTYGWTRNTLKFNARYLKGRSKGQETAKYWLLGLRYERSVSDKFSIFTAYSIDSDIYSGFDPRHSVDVGAIYTILKDDTIVWNSELGYRFMSERQTATMTTKKTSRARAYSEATYNWTKTFSTKLWAEYMPNLSAFDDYMINGELSANAAISEVFSLKAGYLVRYRNITITPTSVPTDRTFTTAIVAKF